MMCSYSEMLLLSVLVTLISAAIGISIDPVVDTPLGQLRGYRLTSRSGRQFLAFSGVPYAKPPLDHLRFQPPEPLEPWEGIKDATKTSPKCTQFVKPWLPDVIGQEDCLYLSVYTHNPKGNAPVLIHIHGGGFYDGHEAIYGPQFFMDEDVVIVNINYRLSAFGFLTLESPELPGNQGVKDQLMALRWVQQNIASFGGNPNLVTIIGESAGGASVFNHIISPLSKGLFHRVISQSGTSYSSWAVTPPGYRRNVTETLLTLLDCPTNPKDALPCISAKDTKDIMAKSKHFTEGLLLPFGPVIEAPGPDSFIVGLPNEWQHNSVPLFIGTDSEEGLLFTGGFTEKNYDFKSFAKNFNRNAPTYYGYIGTASKPDEITKEIRKFYLNKDEFTLEDFTNLTKIYSDAFFTTCVFEGANRHTGNTYFYYFDKKIPVSIDDKYVTGAMHTAETRYLWYIPDHPLYAPLVDKDDIELSKQLVKIVGTFVRTGEPVIEGRDLEWKRWTKDNHNYIQIDKEGFHLKKGLAEDRYSFWKSINYLDKFWDNS